MRIDNLVFGAALLLTVTDAMAGPLVAFMPAIATVLASAAAAKISSNAARRATPTAADVKPPTVMPMADDEATMFARRRQIAEMQSRSGRASTILSQDDRLGG